MFKIETVNLNNENLIKIKEIDDIFYKEAILTIDWYMDINLLIKI